MTGSKGSTKSNFLPWSAERAFKHSPFQGMPTRTEVSPLGVTQTSERGEQRLLWSDFRTFRTNSKVTLLYLRGAGLAVLLAARFTPADYERVQAIVRNSVGSNAKP